MKIYHRSFSERGSRKNNEDYIAFREMPGQDRCVFVLCDGMGGHDYGEMASKLVAEHICDYWVKNPKRKNSQKKVVDACDETMIAFNNKSRVEMGTTMAMVAIEGDKAILAHCGDSRIYFIRDHEIIYQSVDHVSLTPEGWPVLSRAFFTRRNNYKPDIEELEVKAGDIILICSDGVSGNGKCNELNKCLTTEGGLDIDEIYNIALFHCNDNISAILIEIGL